MGRIVWISFQTVRKSLRREDLLSALQQEAETWRLNSMANITAKWISCLCSGKDLTMMHNLFEPMIHYVVDMMHMVAAEIMFIPCKGLV